MHMQLYMHSWIYLGVPAWIDLVEGVSKKSAHASWSLHPKPGLLEHCTSDGQNKTFQGLFWGIVRLFRSNTFGDALKNMKKQNSQKT